MGEGRALAASVAAVLAFCGATTVACGGDAGRRGAQTAAGLAGSVGCGGKNTVTAGGSTGQQRAMALFDEAWGRYCPGKSLSYNATGSGAGREQFIAGHVDLAAADSPLVTDQIQPAAKRCDGNPAWDLPVAFGPIALIYNLPGVPALVVSSDALARIFTGRITAWNDPILRALNPGVVLPDTRIVPIYRSDSSGTTDNVQKYLTAAAPQSWAKGVGTDFLGGAGEGAPTSDGVIGAVRATPGGLGYVEKGFADQAGIPYAQIGTSGGVIPLTNDTAAKGVSAVRFVADGNDLMLDLNPMYSTQDPGAYPLVSATYQIVCSNGYDAGTAGAIKSFLAVVASDGQAGLASAAYVPLPDNVKERLVTAIEAIQ